jgi:hypothetical protein
MLDFLQVVPGGGELITRDTFNAPSAPVMLSPSPQEGSGLLEIEGSESDEVPALPPAPDTDLKATDGDMVSEERGAGAPDDLEVLGETEGGWPLRQIEIGLGSLLFALAAMMLVAWRKRRKQIRV